MSAEFSTRHALKTAPLLVGRDREIVSLREATHQAIGGHGGLVLISGEAGIGKTTLVQHLVSDARENSALILSGAAYDLSATPPYGPWLELISDYQHSHNDNTVPEAISDREAIARLGSREDLSAAVLDFLATTARQQPLLLVLEDLHWADQASLDLLRVVGRRIADQQILIAATYRDDEIHRTHPLYTLLPAIIRESSAGRIELTPLDSEAIEALVASTFTLRDDEQQALTRHVQAWTEGNPLFAVELVRTLELEGLGSVNAHPYALGELPEMPVPDLIQQMIERRMSSIPESGRVALQAAAVIGQHVPLHIWEQVVDPGDVVQAVEAALEQQLAADLPGNRGISFRHALVREAIYESLSFARRLELHRTVAERYLEHSNPDPETVAWHLRQAGDPRAIDWLILAGIVARQSAAWISAAESFGQAAILLRERGEDPHAQGWLFFQSGYLRRFSQDPKMVYFLAEADRTAREQGDSVLAAYLEYHRGSSGCMGGHVRRGLTRIERGVRALEELFEESSAPPTNTQAMRIITARLPENSSARQIAWREPPTGEVKLSMATQRGVLVNWLAQSGRYRESRPMGERFLAEMTRAFGENTLRMSQCLSGRLGLAISYSATGQPDDARREYDMARQGFAGIGEPAMVDHSCWIELFWATLPYFTDDLSRRNDLVQIAEDAWSQATGAVSWEAPVPEAAILTNYIDGRWRDAYRQAETLQSVPAVKKAKFARLILGLLDRQRSQSALAWNRVHEVLPNGPDSEPGDGYYPVDVSVLALAIQLSLDGNDRDGACSWLEAHDRWLDWSGAFLGRAESALHWGRYHLMSGNLDRAGKLAKEALRLASYPRQPLVLISIRRLLGDIGIEMRDYEKARRHFDDSMDIAAECNVPFERASTILAQARLEIARSNQEEARRLLSEARHICEPLDAHRMLDQVRELSRRSSGSATPSSFGISARELDVLRCITEGKTDKEIAEELFISPRTVMQHVSSILRKLDVDSRTAAAARAMRTGIV